jgi:hypothetical protein
MQRDTVKPFKLCRKCGKNYCLSGYCSFCRDKDATAATIKAREEMDKAAGEKAGLKLLFEYVDVSLNTWAGKMLEGEPWLLRKINGRWVTVRKLTEQEVEGYQKLSGLYPRRA